MLTELTNNKYGISWAGMWAVKNFPQLKTIALAATDGGPYVAPTTETIQDRTYPLARSIYMYLKHPPGQPLEPKLKEFLRYILSRQGQEDVAHNGKYLPLTAEVVREQLKKLE